MPSSPPAALETRWRRCHPEGNWFTVSAKMLPTCIKLSQYRGSAILFVSSLMVLSIKRQESGRTTDSECWKTEISLLAKQPGCKWSPGWCWPCTPGKLTAGVDGLSARNLCFISVFWRNSVQNGVAKSNMCVRCLFIRPNLARAVL